MYIIYFFFLLIYYYLGRNLIKYFVFEFIISNSKGCLVNLELNLISFIC